jgi:SpoVK/Ycf46/Vps4 family AAA+-type ATPase
LVILIDGPSGTGKTMLAGALAQAFGLDLYRVDVSQLFSKWIGETEKNLARVFDAAEQARVMVLFDEADSVFARRAAVQSSTDRYSNLEINYVLQRLETFDGVVVLTTNLGSEIDPAFRRRISCALTLPLPDTAAREQIWRNHLPSQMPIADAIDVADLARRHELSGGAIKNAAVRAAFYAASDGTPVSQFHIERAVRAELRDRNARVPDGQGLRR